MKCMKATPFNSLTHSLCFPFHTRRALCCAAPRPAQPPIVVPAQGRHRTMPPLAQKLKLKKNRCSARVRTAATSGPCVWISQRQRRRLTTATVSVQPWLMSFYGTKTFSLLNFYVNWFLSFPCLCHTTVNAGTETASGMPTVEADSEQQQGSQRGSQLTSHVNGESNISNNGLNRKRDSSSKSMEEITAHKSSSSVKPQQHAKQHSAANNKLKCVADGRLYNNGQIWHPVIGPLGSMQCVVCKCADSIIQCGRVCPDEGALKSLTRDDDVFVLNKPQTCSLYNLKTW